MRRRVTLMPMRWNVPKDKLSVLINSYISGNVEDSVLYDGRIFIS